MLGFQIRNSKDVIKLTARHVTLTSHKTSWTFACSGPSIAISKLQFPTAWLAWPNRLIGILKNLIGVLQPRDLRSPIARLTWGRGTTTRLWKNSTWWPSRGWKRCRSPPSMTPSNWQRRNWRFCWGRPPRTQWYRNEIEETLIRSGGTRAALDWELRIGYL